MTSTPNFASLMKMPIRGKNPPVLRPAPFGKGGHWGIFRRCFERGAAHFHLLCCADRYMSYFAGVTSRCEILAGANQQHWRERVLDDSLGDTAKHPAADPR